MESRDILGGQLDLGPRKMRFDSAVKKIFSDKRVLAVLLKELVQEYSSIPLSVIAEELIVDYRQLGSQSGVPAIHGGRAMTASTEILGKSAGVAHLDVLFYAHAPQSDSSEGGQIINIEFQNNNPASYDIIKRGIYYVSCIIYEQYGATLFDSQYDCLLKTSSIWICPWLTEDGMDSANRYCLTELPIIGAYRAPVQSYDMPQVIVIRFNPDGTEHPSQLIGMLQTLFTSKLSPAEKKRILADRYSIAIEEEEMKKMIDFSEVYKQLGKKEGLTQGRAEGLTQGRAEGLTQGRAEGLTQGRAEGFRQSFAELVAIGNSQCTVQMAIRHIQQGLMKLEDIMDFLTPDETAELKRRLAKTPDFRVV